MTERRSKELEKLSWGRNRRLRKHEAEKKLEEIIGSENGKRRPTQLPVLRSDDSVTFDWLVAERYFPMRRGRWRPATKDKTEFEINKYLIPRFENVPLRKIGTFEIQMLLNDLAQQYSESIVKHAYVNVRAIMRMAHKLKFIEDNPAEDTSMPETKPVDRPTMAPEQIVKLIDAIEDPHDLWLMSIGLFCATRTSETFGLQWKSYARDRFNDPQHCV